MSATTASKTYSYVNKALLGFTVILAGLSFAPPLRYGVNIALRGIGLLSAFMAAGQMKEDKNASKSLGDWVLWGLKGLALILGLAAVIVALGPLLIASFAFDLALQLGSFFYALYKNNPAKAVLHLAVAVMDGLAIGAIVTGAWPFVVAALSIGVVTFFSLAVYAAHCGQSFEALCYAILGIMGIAAAVSAAPSGDQEPDKSKFDLDNTKGDDPVTLTDANDKPICTIEPGHYGHCEAPYYDTFHNEYTVYDGYWTSGYDPYWGWSMDYVSVETTYYSSAVLANLPNRPGLLWDATSVSFKPVMPSVDQTVGVAQSLVGVNNIADAVTFNDAIQFDDDAFASSGASTSVGATVGFRMPFLGIRVGGGHRHHHQHRHRVR